MATKIQSHFRRILMQKQFEVQVENKLKEYLAVEKLKIGDKHFHLRLSKHEEKLYINARNIQSLRESYQLEIQSPILKNYLLSLSDDPEERRLIFKSLKLIAKPEPINEDSQIQEETLSLYLDEDEFMQQYLNIGIGHKETINKKQNHISAQSAAIIIQKFVRAKTQRITRRVTLWTKWFKDKNEYKVKFMTYQSLAVTESTDKRLDEQMSKIELSIFDKQQRRTILAEEVKFEQYKKLINLSETEFQSEMQKKLSGNNLRVNGRTRATSGNKKDVSHRKQFSFAGK